MHATDTAAASTATIERAQDIRRVLVVGAGQMGSGIAQVFASADRDVWLTDVDSAGLDRARDGIRHSVGKLHAKSALSEDQVRWCTERIAYVGATSEVEPLQVDMAIEAIVESVEAKTALLSELDACVRPGGVIASNTSSISITRLGAATSRPGAVVGMHFMNPPPLLDLVEVVPGLDTERQVVALVHDLARDLGKTPVESADAPGFITNRVLMPMINEALFCLESGVGSAEAIDEAMRLGMCHPLGPLALADLIGLDTCLAIIEVLHRELGDDKYRPCPLLRRYVDAGRYGRKSGRGIYEYGAP